jgi:carboxyl-terminal processing protease
MKIKFLTLLLVFFVGNTTSAQTVQSFDKLFDEVWAKAKGNIYPQSLEEKFTTEKYLKLKGQIGKIHTLNDFSKIVNKFLLSLSISHTGFLTSNEETYYFLKSTFNVGEQQESPKLGFIGVQLKKDKTCNYRVREVLDGFSAFKIGIKRGDCLTSLDGKDVETEADFDKFNGKKVKLDWFHGDKRISKFITPESVNIADAFFLATKSSAKVIKLQGKKIGYVRLWTGSHLESASLLDKLVNEKFKSVDGMVLDLRGGYGGAWWDHLIPFFPNTSSFFKATKINRDGTKNELPMEFKENPHHFKKPMVVLINEGVRSGKEALAYQFKKTKRALLVGTTTAGYFVAGRPFFVEENVPYILYLSVYGILLDGENIEGIGVRPDLEINYGLEGLDHDPQYDFALEKIQELI